MLADLVVRRRVGFVVGLALLLAVSVVVLPIGCGGQTPIGGGAGGSGGDDNGSGGDDNGDDGDDGDGGADPGVLKFEDPANCSVCHPKHFTEWQGSIMHYAAVSPVFNAFELTMQKLTEGGFAPNGVNPNFCIECHSPTGVFNDELPDFTSVADQRPARDSLTPISQQGLSCDFCHTVTGPDIPGSLLDDGIANTSLEFEPSDTKNGPIVDPVESEYHGFTDSDFLRSPNFCGGCHDVRIPVPDVITGEPFQRLENLFTEWEQGPYNSTDNPYGKIIRCQDCHMSLYPQEPPGTFPEMIVGAGVGVSDRPHALHAFTAVSIPFIDDPRFPNVYSDAVDEFGYPIGQQQRREQMLQAACTLTLEGTPAQVEADADTIPIRIVVENVGAGHKVPAGFSQERQVWIELVVRDDVGIIYESGYLRDKAHPETGEMEPDGRTDDEDLNDRHYVIDMESFDTDVEQRPDYNQRPEVNLGLVNFQNAFIQIHEDGTWEEVLNPLLVNHMDNSRSLDMLTPREVQYDVPMPDREIVGLIQVSARLRYRAFPPEFLRFLAEREPDLVSEVIVDRNTIVDMVSDEATIRVR
jgi:hypothetical protein